MPDEQLHEIVGVIHIHSSYSDGSKSIEEIAQVGEVAGLDYLMFSDHMTLKPLRDGLERYHGKVAVIIGYEIEDAKNENHYLAFGLQKELKSDLSAREYVAGVKAAGGLGIIAHPDEIRNSIPEYPSYPWTAWDAEGYDAIEIWNHMSAWMELLKRINVLKMIVTPRRGLRGPTSRILKKWDEIAEKRDIAGIGSADVHAHAYRKGPIKVTIFPYKVQFRSIRTHLLLDKPLSRDIAGAKAQILEAIRSCRVFVSNYRWGDARGFNACIKGADRVFHVGETVPFSKSLNISINSPLKAEIRLIHNGIMIDKSISNYYEAPIKEPGLYRVELMRKKRGWIYSNHLKVFKKT
jgi:hypothetical protein